MVDRAQFTLKPKATVHRYTEKLFLNTIWSLYWEVESYFKHKTVKDLQNFNIYTIYCKSVLPNGQIPSSPGKKSFSFIIHISYRTPLVTLIPSVLKREHLERHKNDTTVNWGHKQPDVCSYLCMRTPAQYQWKFSLTTEHWRDKGKRKKFTTTRQTDWPPRDPHMIDRIQMSRRGTCQVNSTAKCIPTVPLHRCSVQLQTCCLSCYFLFVKIELVD